MTRLLLALLLLFALSLSIPPLRERAVPKYRAFGEWAWGYLEGPMTPALTPMRRMETKAELAEIANQLILFRNRGYPPPAGQEITPFVQRATEDSTATDSWGSPYYLQPQGDSIYVRSAGPDAKLGTPDDLSVAVRFASPASNRRRR